jgi:hypothetical protein
MQERDCANWAAWGRSTPAPVDLLPAELSCAGDGQRVSSLKHAVACDAAVGSVETVLLDWSAGAVGEDKRAVRGLRNGAMS